MHLRSRKNSRSSKHKTHPVGLWIGGTIKDGQLNQVAQILGELPQTIRWRVRYRPFATFIYIKVSHQDLVALQQHGFKILFVKKGNVTRRNVDKHRKGMTPQEFNLWHPGSFSE